MTAESASGADVTAASPVSPGDLLARRLLFVTGKGGVGKTTVAAALARLGATRVTLAAFARALPRPVGVAGVGPSSS